QRTGASGCQRAGGSPPQAFVIEQFQRGDRFSQVGWKRVRNVHGRHEHVQGFVFHAAVGLRGALLEPRIHWLRNVQGQRLNGHQDTRPFRAPSYQVHPGALKRVEPCKAPCSWYGLLALPCCRTDGKKPSYAANSLLDPSVALSLSCIRLPVHTAGQRCHGSLAIGTPTRGGSPMGAVFEEFQRELAAWRE